MFSKLTVLTALVVAAIVLTGVASAGSRATTQRIAITSQGAAFSTFVLTPLTAGAVVRDAGSSSACCWTQRFVTRDGESVEIDNPLKTFVGKQGSFTWRAQISWVEAGADYVIGTGPWKIVRGTGAYAHLHGGGRLVTLIHDSDNSGVTLRAEGVVSTNG
jgi:hypothetical protein